ncbi:MAG: anthranilate synthase component I family protein [Kofleriaceae bacterium]
MLGYDLARAVERLGPGPAEAASTPALWFGAYPALARWDRGGTGELVGEPAAVAALADALAAPAPPRQAPRLGPLVAGDDTDELHRQRIERALAYIAAGDVYQVNLARRLRAEVRAPGDPLALLEALLAEAPAPYAALIEADGATVVSGSPERFLARVDDRLETRPIKGTRPRGATAAADDALAAELAGAAKDGAEHLMIVDLERNDLGRIAEVGSVRVDRLGYGVALPQVHHQVSRISARPRAEVGLAALLRATFPGGSITGAPKVRAMQLIDELERGRRGAYCGAFGYLGDGGGLDLAIAIRIGVLTADELRVHVGGGIVADSDPDAELAEAEVKALGWRRALARLDADRLSSPG